MSRTSSRGAPSSRSARATRRGPPVPPGKGSAATGKKRARSRFRKPDVAVDRIVVMRIALAAIVLAFLYLVVWIGIHAFGGGGARQAKKIESVIIEATTSSPAASPTAPRTDAAKSGAAPR